jgi:hypothetical protein
LKFERIEVGMEKNSMEGAESYKIPQAQKPIWRNLRRLKQD